MGTTVTATYVILISELVQAQYLVWFATFMSIATVHLFLIFYYKIIICICHDIIKQAIELVVYQSTISYREISRERTIYSATKLDKSTTTCGRTNFQCYKAYVWEVSEKFST